MSWTYTNNCVICLKEIKKGTATRGGHVHKDDGTSVIASFHTECDRNPTIRDCKGCYGKWTPEMGESEPFGQVGYIDSDGFHEEE